MAVNKVPGESPSGHAEDQNIRTIDLGAGGKAVWIDSDRLEACIEYFVRNRLVGVAISPLDGFKLRNVQFLARLPTLEHLTVLHSEMIDVSAINGLRALRYLQLTGKPDQRIDLANFPALCELKVQWWPRLNFNAPLSVLRVLHLRGYRTQTEGLSALPALPSVEDLELVQCPIPTMTGIEQFSGLKRLGCYYLSKLKHIAPIAAGFHDKSLTVLECGHCPKIVDHDQVKVIKSLKVLHFNYCGKLATLHFLDDLPVLEDFRFVGTDVLDGDLQPCMRLKRVGFSQRRHYSHRYADFAIQAQKNKEISDAQETKVRLK